MFFLVAVLAPFIVEIAMVIQRHELDIHALRTIPPVHDIQWAVFLSTIIWSYGGFDSMGSLAGNHIFPLVISDHFKLGEVKGGRSTFMRGLLGSFPLIFMNYFWPIFIGYSIDTNYQDWTSGYFTPLAYKLTKWLGIWMAASSAVR